MKWALLFLFLTVVSATAYVMDLQTLARRERARRQALSATERGRLARSYDDDDLERYRREREPPKEAPRPRVRAVFDADDRDLAAEEAHWREETSKHRRELDRLDASIRRLEWRLSERRSRRLPGERLGQDPSLELLEDSIESLKADRKRLDEEFHERARKAGAFPGWLR